MRFAVFCHSIVSDWNHGNAHFLRGVVTELEARSHAVEVFEPRDSWSFANLEREIGPSAEARFRARFPTVDFTRYDPSSLDLDEALDGVDVVLVHEWNDPSLVASLGRRRQRADDFILLFHDSHHRAATSPQDMARFELAHYDGVLAFGRVIRDIYLDSGWTQRAWVWHEAADVRVFEPRDAAAERDLVWIGNWGDDERSRELSEFLIGPARALQLSGTIHGVRYPRRALAALEDAGLSYEGWVPNYEVPDVFARHRLTVHVPRRPYASALPGVPTIRMFEALACGIPLVSAPWTDAEGLFTPGEDYLVASDGEEMTTHVKRLLHDDDLRASLAEHGRATIRARHTCGHRVDELLSIVRELS